VFYDRAGPPIRLTWQRWHTSLGTAVMTSLAHHLVALGHGFLSAAVDRSHSSLPVLSSSSSGDLVSTKFLRLPAPRRPRRASPPPGAMPSWGDGSYSSNEVLGVNYCSRITFFRVRVSDLGFSWISLISVAIAEIPCTS
jgi:hypothetical protein